VAEGVPKEVLTKANLEEVYRISPRQEYPANTSIALPWKTKNVDT
jgi:ABC-type cobalamin/Fe3+-siderophores transport system ATPase subunit